MAAHTTGSPQVHVRLDPAIRQELDKQLKTSHSQGLICPRTIQDFLTKAVIAYLIINAREMRAETAKAQKRADGFWDAQEKG